MSEIQLDERIQRVGKVATEAFAELHKLQQGQNKLLKTSEEMIDSHIGGLLPGDCVLIAGAPSAGKSETLYRMIDKIMDVEVNSNAMNFVSCEWSMEMKMLNKMLRSTHNITGKKKSEILFEPFSAEDAKKVKDYYENLQDNRRYVVQAPVTPKEFYTMARDFCLLHADKDAILLSADHLLLYTGNDKQSVLEQISESINLLKLEFKNVYFLLLSQLNRSYNAIIKAKSNEMIPTNSLIFGSSFMEQLASYIIIITNPFKQSIDQYLKVSRDRYDYLSEFFGEEDKNGRISFETLGNLFFFVTKVRESDNAWRDLYIRKMDLSKEQLSKMKQSIEVNNSSPSFPATPVFSSTPIFEPSIPTPATLNDAFGSSFESNKEEDDSNKPF